jgi:hypothetical protein
VSRSFNLVQGSPTILTFIDPQYEAAFAAADDNKIKSFANKNINLFNFFEDAQGEEYDFSLSFIQVKHSLLWKIKWHQK